VTDSIYRTLPPQENYQERILFQIRGSGTAFCGTVNQFFGCMARCSEVTVVGRRQPMPEFQDAPSFWEMDGILYRQGHCFEHDIWMKYIPYAKRPYAEPGVRKVEV
jgi:hypothetical protein